MNQFFKSVGLPGLRSLTHNNAKNVRSLTKSYAKNFSNYNKDIVEQNPSLQNNTDLLINHLRNSKSVHGVLELVNAHYAIMETRHTMQALRTIFLLQKHGKSGMSTSQILKHPDFERVCNQLKYHAGTIELNDTVEALKVMTYVGVSSDSLIYQILLQLLRHNINQLSLQHIIFLDFLLSKAKSTPLLEAIRIALPIVYDIQLPIKLDQTNLSHLAEHLYYASRQKVSEHSITLINNALMKINSFDAKNSISIIWSICDMDSNTFFEPLLNKAMKFLFRLKNEVSYNDLETTITKLLKRYNSKTPFYYYEALFDYCADVVINDDLGFEYAVHLLKKFLKVDHINNNILDYISRKCAENPDLIINGDPLHVYYIICTCALTDYRPKRYDVIQNCILQIQNFNNFVKKDLHLLKLQTALAVLNIYIPEILALSLNEEYLSKLVKKNYMLDSENILLLAQTLKSLRPELVNCLPSDEIIRAAKSKLKIVVDYPLQGSLHQIFGGEKFVKTKGTTKMFHHIDHVIILKTDGSPYVINPLDVYVEDIKCDSPSQIVLIMVLNNMHYTINCQRLKGTTSLMLKTLEAKGYTVVPICLKTWQSLLDFEKLPYIMEAIKSKTENIDKIYDVS